MENKQQPEALRYADMLSNGRWMNYTDRNDAADELRRLHAESEQHLQELAAHRFTVDNLRARVAELEAQLAAAPQAVQAVAWLAEYVDREGNSKWYVSTHKDLATENDMNAEPKPLYTHPAQQGFEQFIEQLGDVHFQRCRVGSKEGEIRWDIEFGHYGAEVRGKTLREAITKALAAQAKQGGA